MRVKMFGVVAVLCLYLLPLVAVVNADQSIINMIDWVAYLDSDSMEVFWSITNCVKNVTVLVFSIEGNITENDVEIGRVKLRMLSVYDADENKGGVFARFNVTLNEGRKYEGIMGARFWYVDDYQESEGWFVGWTDDAHIRGIIEDVGVFAFAVKGVEYIED